jgi:MtrB/PioB family decaheme-associated outer membrane protein
MSSIVFSFHAQRTLVAMAACAACLSVQAQSANVDASVSFGLGAADGSKADRATFGQYNGLRTESAFPVLGIDYSLRDQEAGKSVDLKGSDLLGQTRDLNLVWKNPGLWKLTADYGELVRFDPNTLRNVAGAETDLKTKRTSAGLGMTKIISPALQFQVDLKSENKEGNRALSLGYICSAALGVNCNLMSPEPVNANHSQVEARISYALEKFRFNVGYYGSFYRNSSTSISTSGLGISSALNQLPLALPPDNQAHQLDVSGSYDFTPTTRGNFKLAWSTASQNADFSNSGLVGPVLQTVPVTVNGVTVNKPSLFLNSAGAKIDTTLAKLGFTSKPLPQLSLLGDLRYENKDDQTPLYDYNTSAVSPTLSNSNRNLPNQSCKANCKPVGNSTVPPVAHWVQILSRLTEEPTPPPAPLSV